jgi:hypothetical protein
LISLYSFFFFLAQRWRHLAAFPDRPPALSLGMLLTNAATHRVAIIYIDKGAPSPD